MINVHYITIISLTYILSVDSFSNNGQTSTINFTPITLIPNPPDIAKQCFLTPNPSDIANKCFLTPTCFYGEKYDFNTTFSLHNNQIIFININELGDAGYYVLEEVSQLLNEPLLIIITNDDIYHPEKKEDTRKIWNYFHNKCQSITIYDKLFKFYLKLDSIVNMEENLNWINSDMMETEEVFNLFKYKIILQFIISFFLLALFFVIKY